MVGPSKILTVSYGTFSCTLEGFDDSFSTMKAIAEYFRDLAADDRYFGSEPATPDADMLARIAEREIARRVEARTEGTGIVLRAGSALPAPVAAPVAPQEAAADDAEAATTAEPDDESDRPDAPAMPPAATAPPRQAPRPVPAPRPSPVRPPAPVARDAATDDGPLRPAVPAHPDAESVAAKLQRIRAVVGRAAAQADDAEEAGDPVPLVVLRHAADDIAAAPSDASSSMPAPAASSLSPAAEPDEAAAAVPDMQIDIPADLSRAGDLRGVAAAPVQSERTTAAAISLDKAPQQPTVAAPVREPVREPVRARVIRMRRSDFDAAVARGTIDEETSDAEPSATVAPAPISPMTPVTPANATGDDADDRNDGIDLQADGLDEGPATGAAARAGQQDDSDDWDDETDDEIADRMDDALDDDLSADDMADLEALDGTVPSALSDEEEADLLAELAAVEADAAGPATAPAAEDVALAVDDASSADLVGKAVVQGDADIEDALSDAAGDDADEAPFTEHRAGANDTLFDDDAGQSDDAEDDDVLPGDRSDGPDHETNERNASVRAAIGQVMPLADGIPIAPVSTPAPVVAADRDAAGADLAAPALAPVPAPPRRAAMPDADEAAMSRILSQTDAQLNEPEASRRRQAIAQLKAAVAATEAARRLGERDGDDGEVENAFRDDLKQAVRPRRPQPAPENRSERPRPAPLKLVAAQRVDLPSSTDAADPRRTVVAPIRPRRVSAVQEDARDTPVTAAARDAGSFRTFAESMGVTGLSDLLEAAAAYTAYVEGSEDFSRPQLMSKVRETSAREFSREEGLRSFGTLLREGRILRVRNGRFQVSEGTRFHPERRAG